MLISETEKSITQMAQPTVEKTAQLRTQGPEYIGHMQYINY